MYTPPSSGRKRVRGNSPRQVGSYKQRIIDAAINAGQAYVGVPKVARPYVKKAIKYVGSKVVNAVQNQRSSGKKSYKRTMRGHYTQGTYKGKFKVPKKLVNKLTQYANKGVVHTYEVSGTVSDPDCVYLSVRAGDPYMIIQQSVIALMRKLFEKSGYRITNIDEVIVNTAIGAGQDLTVDLTQIDGTTGTESIRTSYTLVAASTINTVAQQFFTNFFEYSAGYSYAAAGNAGTNVHLFRLILYSQDYNVTLGKVFEDEIRLDDELIHINCKADMKIQNRTLSSTSDADTGDVGANPIVGRTYVFPSTPRCRDKSGYLLSGIPINSGIQLARAAQLSGNTSYKEPVQPSVFSNCSSSSKIKLEPGEIRNAQVRYQKAMRFLPFLRKLNLQYGTSGLYNYGGILPCQIFAFEDMINVNSNNLSCAYESNQTIAVFFKTSKIAQGLCSFASATVSNNPP